MEIKIGNTTTQISDHAMVHEVLYAFVNVLRVEGYVPSVTSMVEALDALVEDGNGPLMDAYAEGFSDCISQINQDLEEDGMQLIKDVDTPEKHKLACIESIEEQEVELI